MLSKKELKSDNSFHFPKELSSIKSQDKYVDEYFIQQADKIQKDDFLENPSTFFFTSMGTYVDVKKIIREADTMSDPSGQKALFQKGCLLFCMRFAAYLKKLG